MKHAISSIAIALAVSLPAFLEPASAQIVSQAKTSAGPALTTFDSETILAWAGVSSYLGTTGEITHKVGYKLYDGAWGSQTILTFPTNNTTAAPALATAAAQGDGLNYAYLAWKQDDNLIHYVDSTSPSSFPNASSTICTGTACETITSPALAGAGTTLYAAWTTFSGEVQYASLSGGAWNVYSVPALPTGASTQLAPALAVDGSNLYLAWTNKSNQIQVESAPLPLPASGGNWSSIAPPTATTTAAPALGIGFISDVPWKAGIELFIAWNTGSTIDLAWWGGDGWLSFPGPIPPGPIENFAPAMNYFEETSGCDSLYFFNVAYTLAGADASEIESTTVNSATNVLRSCKM
jgi:hypothetical protein